MYSLNSFKSYILSQHLYTNINLSSLIQVIHFCCERGTKIIITVVNQFFKHILYLANLIELTEYYEKLMFNN
jgi:hypothetical protein